MSETYKWSISTVNTLRQCNRKYYFASVLANFHHTNRLRRKAFELKKMQNLWMWPGSIVDKIMETQVIPLIIAKKEIDFNQIAENAVELAKRQFRFSEEGLYKDPDITKSEAGEDYCVLEIHEIGKPYTEVELLNVYSKIKQSILNIPNIKLPGSDKTLMQYLGEAKPLLPNVTNWSFQIEQSRVNPQMDLILYHNFKPVVIDWKVSDSFTSDYSRQLVVCGLTVYFTRLKKVESEGKKPFEFSDIKLYEVNLFRGEMKEHLFTEERANELIDYINLTGSDIALLSEDLTGDVEDISGFELTENEATCKFCNYQSLCENLLLNNNQYDEESYTKFVQDKQFS
jgi:hypothetical protein